MSDYTRPEAWANRPLPYRTDLDETRGILGYGVDNIPHIQPDHRVTLATLAIGVGRLVDPQILTTEDGLRARLGIDDQDIARSDPTVIEAGLFVPQGDPRYDRGQQLTLVNPKVKNEALEAFKLPFEIESDKQPGVTFSPGDYLKFLLFPKGFQRRTEAKSLHKNRHNTDATEVMRKPKSAQAKSVETYIENLVTLDERYVSEIDLIHHLLRQTHGRLPGRTPQNQYLARNLDVARKRFDGMFYETIESAGRSYGWTVPEVLGVHKADMRRRYFGDDPAQIDAAWQSALKLQGRYTIARRYMIMQYLDMYNASIKRFVPYKKEIFYGKEDHSPQQVVA